jgi:prepilin-type N-terminal cleavage/methylation domain-containing protein
MKIIKIKNYIKEKSKGLALSMPTVSLSNPSKGFTLIETMVAVFIIAMITTSLLGVIATSLYNFRYAKNEMIATYLLQEAADYIRNHRDTEILRTPANSVTGWESFIGKYSNKGCTTSPGCKIDTTKDFEDDFVSQCPSDDDCGYFYFNPNPEPSSGNYFYSYDTAGTITNFQRKIIVGYAVSTIGIDQNDEIWVEVKVDWMNGNLPRTKTLRFSLLRWLS